MTKQSSESQTAPSSPDFQVSAPNIALPKGGGSIHGMGEKFAANPVTGTGSMSIPIATSPGRSGFGPQLSLSYDSGSGNGPFGFGWSLAIPSITRKTDKGLPRYRDAEESDVFMLSGAEDLVPVLEANGNPYKDDTSVPGYSIYRYRPRIEGLFARIERWVRASDGDTYWRSISNDNLTTIYGRDSNSRIADPADPTRRIFSWLICESFDDKGNAIVYEYKAENSEGIASPNIANERNRTTLGRTANRYMKRIKYGNKVSRLVIPKLADDWMFEVVFDYGEHDADVPQPDDIPATSNSKAWHVRQDPFSSHRSGFEVRTYRLCKRVLMFHHFDELGTNDYLVRSTDFGHQASPVATFIKSATQSGYKLSGSSYLKRSLPPVEFTYSEANIDEQIRELDDESLKNLPEGLDGARYQWVDLDGEGLSGILTEQADAWYYKRNLGGGTFAGQQVVARKPSQAALVTGRQQLLDLNGNGQLELVELERPMAGFSERTQHEDWEPFVAFKSLPNIAWHDPNLKFVDLTGDGHADVLISEDEAFSWYASLAEDGFGPGERIRQVLDEEQGPRLVFADGTQSIYLSDMSGDGLTDLVRIRNGEVCYWPNLGYGRFGAKVTMDNAPRFDYPDQFDQKRIRLADIDGSGVVDILYLATDGVKLYFNQSGNSWSDMRLLSSFPPIDNLSSVQLADLLGNGTACLVWSSPLPGAARSPLRYIDLMGGQKPHLLISTKNNLGGRTDIQYESSTRFYLADKLAGRPWITKLPFPVHVVTKSTVTDHWRNTKFSSSYSYHHGYFDGIEREFRGFARVEQIDSESYLDFAQGNIDSPNITQDQLLYQPPIKSVTWYHTGAAFERDRILSALKQEYFTVAGFTEHQLPEPTLTPGDLSAEEWREAVRACKGMVLRQEVFELDAGALAQGIHTPVRLYNTAYHNCDIRRLQPQGPNRHAVFLVTESEAIIYSYELDLRQPIADPDPRIAHTLNLRFDDYGRVQQSVAVVYPRLVDYTPPLNTLDTEQIALINEVQKERHLAYTETHFTRELDADPNQHRLPAPCEVLTYELTGDPAEDGFAPSAAGYFTLNDFTSFNLTNALPDQGTKPVIKLEYQQQPANKKAHMRIVEWVRMLYFKDDLSGAKAFGEYAWHGLPYETYKLALTKNLLNAVLSDGNGDKLDQQITSTSTARQVLNDKGASGYLSGAKLIALFAPQVPEAKLAGQYWMCSGIAGFASDTKDHFYLPEEYTDPFGNKTTLEYDGKYDLFIQSSTDAMHNKSGVARDKITGKLRFDYRILAPIEMVDANDNHSEVAVDILGMVVASAIKGKNVSTDPAIEKWEADNLSDFNDQILNPTVADVVAFCTSAALDDTKAREWLGNASMRFVYHFGEPQDPLGESTMSGTCSIVREKHVGRLATGVESDLQVSLECSDGGGNVLMKKVQAEPAPGQTALRWIINGLTVLNNKGKPVKQYEPAFSPNFGCEVPQANGVTPIMYYDAAGRVVRTEMPDGTFSRVEFTPWHVKTFDANDTILESGNRWYAEHSATTASAEDQRAARLAAAHADTPSETHLDSLGREVIAIAHNRTGGVDEKYLTFTKLDAEGKPLWIRDARGNLVMQYITPPKKTRLADESNEDIPFVTIGGTKVYSVPCYDIAGNLLYQHSMDAGDRWMLMDAAGKPMLAWDANDKGEGTPVERRLYRTDYDALHRPTAQWLKPDDADPALVELFEYCDRQDYIDVATGLVVDQAGLDKAQLSNLIGQVFSHKDPSGKATVERIDLSGKPAHITRTLITPDAGVSNGVVDWDAESPLDNETFHQITEYDALGRMTTLYNWHRDITFAANGTQTDTPGTTNRVAVYVPEYNKRGALKAEWLHVRATKNTMNGRISFTQSATPAHNTKAIQEITYNAKGQKEHLKLRNGTITRYNYDPQSFRLQHLYTRRDARFVSDCDSHTADTARPSRSCGVQNLHYTYDPVGNITHIQDDAQDSVFFNGQFVEPSNDYTYDAIYRLIEGTGRENNSTEAVPPASEGSWPAGNIPSADSLRNYTQRYTYDEVGNFVAMNHVLTNKPGWTRHYKPMPDSNRLDQTWYGSSTTDAVTYRHDAHGNMLNMNRVPEDGGLDIQWDWRDMIRGFDAIGGGIATYHYGIDKQRTRKHITRNLTAGGTITEDRIYFGGYELYRRRNPQNEVVEEIESLHLFEGEQRVLLVDDVITSSKNTQHPRPDGLTVKPQTLFRYQYSNHLGSASLELDEHAEIISYEEYHPYGTSAYRLMKSGVEAPTKRYRYTGMERDEESGLDYASRRFFNSSTARWLSADPAGLSDGGNLYKYAACNPTNCIDKNGTQAVRFSELPPFLQRKLVYSGQAVSGLNKWDDTPAPRQVNFEDKVLNVLTGGFWLGAWKTADSVEVNAEAVNKSVALDGTNVVAKGLVVVGLTAGDLTGTRKFVEGLRLRDSMETTTFSPDEGFEMVLSGSGTLVTEVVLPAAIDKLASASKGIDFSKLNKPAAKRASAATRVVAAYEKGQINVPEGNIYFQTHATSDVTRSALGIPSSATKIPGFSGFQSAHVIPRDVGLLLKKWNYSPGKALTANLPESVHGAFDAAWKPVWKKLKGSGKTVVAKDIQEMLENAVDSATIRAGGAVSVDTPAFSPAARDAMKARIAAEFKELKIKPNDIIIK